MSVMGVIVILASNHMLFAMKQTEMEIVLSKQKIEELMLKQKQFFMFVIMQLEKLTSHLDQCVESLKVCKNNPKNIEELTGIVEQLNDETIDLINRVNDLNKIETDTLRVKITKFNLHKLIETIQKELLLKSEDLGVEIKVDILKNIEIETDREILRRIIRGILINSLDIRNLCENISIFIERRNEKNVLIIQDNGIEPEELKEISENEKIKNYEIMKFNYRISKKLAQKLGMSMVFKRQKNLNITEITLP
jgi:light-regulated signal transduction histidine kinase (bacteriophytochrome)